MIVLKGNLEHIYLASILQLLCNDKKSGMLRVWNAEDEVRIFLDHGTIVYSMGSQKATRLGYLLRSEGLIPQDQLWHCLQMARERKEALGKILIEQGLITEEKLEELNSWKVEQTLYSLFLWKEGDFEFLDKELDLEGHILTQVDTMEVILEASRRADEMSVIREELPNDTLILTLTDKAHTHQETFDDDTRSIITLIDGNKSIKDIINYSKCDSFTVFKILGHLTESGLVVKTRKQVEKNSEAPAIHFTTIVQVYYDAMTTVCDKIGEKAADLSADIYVQCLEELEPRQQQILSDFSLMFTAEKNMQEMEEKMAAFKNPSEGCLFLISTFDDLLLNLLSSHKTLVGEKENREILQEVENKLSVLHYLRKDSSCGIEIISSEANPTYK